MTVRILIADDHKILREGLKSLLEKQPEFAVVAEAQDGLSAISEAKSTSRILLSWTLACRTSMGSR